MNEVEVVARAVAPMMEGGREFDQMPPTRIELRQWARSGMCSTNDATQDDATALAQSAIAALDAARGDAEPVAWLHHHPKLPTQAFMKPLPRGAEELGWTETPLYAHPPRGDRVARVVEWLRNGGGTDISQLNGSMQMLFLKGMNRYADAIERGEPFNG